MVYCGYTDISIVIIFVSVRVLFIAMVLRFLVLIRNFNIVVVSGKLVNLGLNIDFEITITV
jgi:hypothetical protein